MLQVAKIADVSQRTFLASKTAGISLEWQAPWIQVERVLQSLHVSVVEIMKTGQLDPE